jgi:hypothetical protein
MDSKTKALFSSPCDYRAYDYFCRDADCETAVVEYEGRWYVTFGHAGFNSPANNCNGYVSKAKALAAVKHYSNN